MKNIFLLLFFCFPVLLYAATPADGSQPVAGKESTKLSLYVPGFLMEVGSWFVPKEKEPELKTALKKIRSTSIVVREGCAYNDYNASGKYARKMKRMSQQQFEELVVVNSMEERVSVQLRQNKKDKIRQVVVLADDGCSSFVFLRLRCNIGMHQLKQWMDQDGFISSKVSNKISI
ncbi:MAG: DUF4252 domain-containing protein [Chitinophagales bacterium]|nr:DUF4252 domain-containing protein [Chitinophagales bacterium]